VLLFSRAPRAKLSSQLKGIGSQLSIDPRGVTLGVKLATAGLLFPQTCINRCRLEDSDSTNPTIENLSSIAQIRQELAIAVNIGF
jgi:hypothetical protein